MSGANSELYDGATAGQSLILTGFWPGQSVHLISFGQIVRQYSIPGHSQTCAIRCSEINRLQMDGCDDGRAGGPRLALPVRYSAKAGATSGAVGADPVGCQSPICGCDAMCC